MCFLFPVDKLHFQMISSAAKKLAESSIWFLKGEINSAPKIPTLTADRFPRHCVGWLSIRLNIQFHWKAIKLFFPSYENNPLFLVSRFQDILKFDIPNCVNNAMFANDRLLFRRPQIESNDAPSTVCGWVNFNKLQTQRGRINSKPRNWFSKSIGNFFRPCLLKRKRTRGGENPTESRTLREFPGIVFSLKNFCLYLKEREQEIVRKCQSDNYSNWTLKPVWREKRGRETAKEMPADRMVAQKATIPISFISNN